MIGTSGHRDIGTSTYRDIEPSHARQMNRRLNGLVLDNLWTDPPMIHEFVAMRFFELMGQPEPRESFARLYVNNVFQGVYAVVEQIDSDFARRTLNETG